jgi:hypothetical protein
MWTRKHTFSLLLIIIAILPVGLLTPSTYRLYVWLGLLILLTVFALIAGHGLTGMWLGLLIDERNKMSLSRLQMILWTVLILSGFLTVALANIAAGVVENPLAISIPEELWLLMGISTASLVGSPLIMSTKKVKEPKEEEQNQTIVSMAAEEGVSSNELEPKVTNKGQVIVNKDPKYARLSDLFKGEETGNAAQLDLGKIQMFYFTLILVFAYAVALGDLLCGTGKIDAFPVLSSSMVALLGISHAGYLTNKAIPHSQVQ